MAERKQTSPEVLRERSPAPRAFPRYWTTAILPPLVASPPLTGEIRFQRASRYHFPQGLSDARADFIDYRTRYPSSLTSARDRSEHTGRRVARTRIPPTVTSRAAGQKRLLSLSPPLSRAYPPRPCSIVPSAPSAVHFGFTRFFARGTICSDSSAEARQRRRPSPKPPHRLARVRETPFLRGRRH